MNEVTRIINAIQQGDGHASEELLPLVYEELRLLAAQKLSHEIPGQTLQATALVHEAYLRLIGTNDPAWEGKGHFFAAAAEAMRRILIENARRKKSLKRGGDLKRIDFSLTAMPIEQDSNVLIALDEALQRLAAEDSTKSELVKLRFFTGLSIDQAAEVLGIARSTAIRHWSFARAWLLHEVQKGIQIR